MKRHLDIGIPILGERLPGVLLDRAQRWCSAGNQGHDVGAVLPEQRAGHGGITAIRGFDLQPRFVSGEFGEWVWVTRDGKHGCPLGEEGLRYAPTEPAARTNDDHTFVGELVHPYLPHR